MSWLDYLAKKLAGTPPPNKRPTLKPVKQWLTPRLVARIKRHKADYQWAVRKVGAGQPWQMLMAVHYREFGLRFKLGYPGGPFQLDRGGKGKAVRDRRRRASVAKVMRLYGVKAWGTVGTDFRTAALMCAHMLKLKRSRKWDKTGPRNRWPEEVLADTWFAYNGRARYYNQKWQVGYGSNQRNWRWSPYPSNFLGGIPLHVKGTQDNARGQRVAIPKRRDRNAGAILVYREAKRLKV